MATPRKKPHVKKATKLKRKDLQLPLRVLALIGRPLYLIIVLVSIGLLYIVSLLGYSIRISIETIVAFFRSIVKNTSSNITTIVKRTTQKISSVKVAPPKKPSFSLNLPSVTFTLELTFLTKIKTFLLAKGNTRFDKPISKIIALLVIFLFVGAVTFWFFILKDLPDVKALSTRSIEVSTKIYDRNGVLLYKIYKDKNRTITPLSEIPDRVKLATLAAEDAEFYKHKGISVRGILRAFFKNLERGQLSGGSTITQQLVKNALLSSEKTLTRKLKEVALAVEVELTYSKDQILEMYLNEVPFGGTAYGITEASNVYFGKDVKDLNTAEAAYLAGLPRSPSKYSPFSGNFEDGLNRQKDVINLMKVNGFITEEEKNKALTQKLTFASNHTDIKAPHFVMYVRSLLAEKYGEDAVETGGLDVVTTLDYSIQRLAEEVLQKEVEKLKPLHVGNGAVVILDPKTNEILAMVGSKDYFDLANDGNVNVTLRPRSPGSSIKLINYAYALSNSYTAASIIDDSPVVYKVTGQPPYSPKNYDGGFHGKVTLRSALARSLNIPAVKVLNSYGVSNMIDLGEKMGITTWGDRSRFGLSLTLGGGEVRLIDLAKVYSVVADYGNKKDTTAIKKVTNYKGEVFEENFCKNLEKQNDTGVKAANAKEPENAYQCEGEQVLDQRVAYILTDILRDNTARAPSFGRNSQLVIPNHPEVAVKTGTSNDLRDNLTVGFTRNYLVAVWVGNNDNSPMSRIASGLTGASTIFNKIMSGLLAKEVSVPWEVPQGLKQIAICTYTGTLPCTGCPTKVEWFLDEKRPGLACKEDQIMALKKNEEERLQKLNVQQGNTGQILEPAYSTQFIP